MPQQLPLNVGGHLAKELLDLGDRETVAHEFFFGGHVDAVVAGEAYGRAGDSEVNLGRAGKTVTETSV